MVLPRDPPDTNLPTLDIENKLVGLLSDLEAFSKQWLPSDSNIFEAIGLDRQEIKHSNFLAFLLNPQNKHGLGDDFLKKIIQRASDKVDEPPIRPLALALADFSDALVSREWRNIDIFVESKNNNFLFVIENKIGSFEGPDQLRKYERLISTEYPLYSKLFCYLTPEGEDASRPTWAPISYREIIEALQSGEPSSRYPTEAMRIVIKHYADLIRRNVVPDQALIDQCRKLYQQHKDALDLIIRYGEVSALRSAFEQFFKNHQDLKVLGIRTAQAAFLPLPIYQTVPELSGATYWGQTRPFALFFNLLNSNKFGIVFEVAYGQFDRESLIGKLQAYFKTAGKITTKYTRVFSYYITLTDDQLASSEEILLQMEALYKQVVDRHLPMIVEILGSFFRVNS